MDERESQTSKRGDLAETLMTVVIALGVMALAANVVWMVWKLAT